MSRAKTEAEVRDEFLGYMRELATFWQHAERGESDGRSDIQWRIEGVVFSVLATLDGGSELPGFTVTPSPHPSDKAFHQGEGESWYPCDVNIAGELHERWCKGRS